MTASCIALDQIQSRTATSMALAIYARRVREGFFAFTCGRPLLFFLVSRVNQLNASLRSGALEKLSDEQLREVAGLLKQLHVYLVRLSQDERVNGYWVMKSSLRSIQESAEDLESIIENIFLSLDPGFHKAVSSATEKLKLGAEERAAMLR
jgi:hypothetical protein